MTCCGSIPFLPEASFGLQVLSLTACVCVCVSVNHELVCVITHQQFKLESPNLDQRCERSWLRFLLFLGAINCQFEGEIELEIQNLPHFELVRVISHHQLKSVFPNFYQKYIIALLRSLSILGWIDLAGKVVDYVGIYGSKAAEGCTAFQRRSCFCLSKAGYLAFDPCPHRQAKLVSFESFLEKLDLCCIGFILRWHPRLSWLLWREVMATCQNRIVINAIFYIFQ